MVCIKKFSFITNDIINNLSAWDNRIISFEKLIVYLKKSIMHFKNNTAL